MIHSAHCAGGEFAYHPQIAHNRFFAQHRRRFILGLLAITSAHTQPWLYGALTKWWMLNSLHLTLKTENKSSHPSPHQRAARINTHHSGLSKPTSAICSSLARFTRLMSVATSAEWFKGLVR